MNGRCFPFVVLVILGRGLLGFGSLLLMLLSACQSRQPAENAHATPTVRPVVAPRPTSSPPAADSTPTLSARPEKQTLFPDTLHPIELSVQYWTGPQVDSIRAAVMLAADSLEANSTIAASWVELWTDRCRVLRYDEDTGKRLFFRPRGATSPWVELDLNTWMDSYNSLPYLNARAVELDQRPPQELLVTLGGSLAGQGSREAEDYTLLISFDGPPHIVWYSLNGRTEEISPYQTNDDTGEMEGGNYASAHRKITVRGGRVRVGRVQQDGKFESGDEFVLTPITPGTYTYRGGRFRRAAS